MKLLPEEGEQQSLVKLQSDGGICHPCKGDRFTRSTRPEILLAKKSACAKGLTRGQGEETAIRSSWLLHGAGAPYPPIASRKLPRMGGSPAIRERICSFLT